MVQVLLFLALSAAQLPKRNETYVCNFEKYKCEEGYFRPAFKTLAECEQGCKVSSLKFVLV